MGIIAKQSYKNAIIMYSGAVIGAINTVLLYPRVLPKEEIGLITSITSFAILIAAIGGFGSTSSIIRFLPHFRNDQTKSNGGLLSFLVIICISLSVLIAILLIVFRDQIQGPYLKGAKLIADYYYWIIPLFVINMLIDLFSNYANSLFKSGLQMFQKEVFLRLGQTTLIGLYFGEFIDFHGFIIGYLLLYLTSFVILLFYLGTLGELHPFSGVRLSRKHQKEVIKFGGFTFFSSIANNFAFRMDILMIGAMVVTAGSANGGLEAAAIYTVALYMAAVIEMPYRAMNQIVNPAISNAWKEQNMGKVSEVYTKSTETMVVVGAYIFLGIWVCIDDVIKILPVGYEDVKYVFLWLGLGKFFNVACGSNGQVLVNSPSYKVFTVFTIIGLVLTFVTNFILIHFYQITGAALATAITYFLINVIIFYYLYRKYDFQPFGWSSLKTLLLVLLLATIVPLMQVEVPVLGIVVKASIMTLVYGIAVYKLKLSNDIISFVDGTYRKLSRKN